MAVTQIGSPLALPNNGFHSGAAKLTDEYAIHLEASGFNCVVSVIDFTTDVLARWGNITLVSSSPNANIENAIVIGVSGDTFLVVSKARASGLNTAWWVEAWLCQVNFGMLSISVLSNAFTLGGSAPVRSLAYDISNDNNELVRLTQTKFLFLTTIEHESNPGSQNNCKLGWYSVVDISGASVSVGPPKGIGEEIAGYSNYYTDPVTYPSPQINLPYASGRINNTQAMVLVRFEDDGQTFDGFRLLRLSVAGNTATIIATIDVTFADPDPSQLNTVHMFPMVDPESATPRAVMYVPGGFGNARTQIRIVDLAGAGLAFAGTTLQLLQSWAPSGDRLSTTRFFLGHHKTGGNITVSTYDIQSGDIVEDTGSPWASTTATANVESAMAMRDQSALVFYSGAGVIIMRGFELQQFVPTSPEFRYVGFDSDDSRFYATVARGNAELHAYDLGSYTMPTKTTFGPVTIAQVEARTAGLYPHAEQFGVVLLRGADGSTYLYFSNDYGDSFAAANEPEITNYVVGVDVGPNADWLLCLADGDILRGVPTLQKIGSAPAAMREFARDRNRGEILLIARQAADAADLSINHGQSFIDASEQFGTVNKIIQAAQ